MSQDHAAMSATHPDPDIQLIWAMANGDTHALDEIYARYGPGLLNYLIYQLSDQQLAEEILQDVMLAAWKNAARFRGESRVRTWLLVIARNRAINARRGKKPTLTELDESYGSETTGLLEKVERSMDAAAVRVALKRLPDPQRDTLELFFFHQLSIAEIAAVQEISEGTVKSRLHRAKGVLRDWLGREEQTDA